MTASTATARRAARSEPVKGLARAGLTARAVVYLLVGVLALTLAFGDRQGEPDQRGALQALTRHTGGTVLVWLIAIGLFGYALWRFSEAAFGAVGEGRKAGPRLKSLFRGLIYLFLGINAVKVATDGGSKSQAGQQQEWTASVMRHTGGRWLIGLVGLIVIICGVVLVVEGITRKFEKYLDRGRMSPREWQAVGLVGTVGTAARGIVFALAGIFVLVAAVEHDPKKAGGLDQALKELLSMGAGPFLVTLAGIGLILFGVYGLAEARWRKT